MIKVRITKKNEKYVALSCEGHSGYDTFGRDIVCSAVSTLVFNTEIALNEVLKVKAKVLQDEKAAKISITLPALSEENEKAVQTIFESLEISLRRIEAQYKKFVNLEVENENV